MKKVNILASQRQFQQQKRAFSEKKQWIIGKKVDKV